MIPPEQAERKRFELWYNNYYDMELITGPDDVEAAWEIWKAAMEDTPVNPVGYVGLTSEGEPTKFRTGNFGSGHPVYLSPVATTAGAEWVKCEDRVPEPARNTRRNRHGILVRFDSGRIERFKEVTEYLVSFMKRGPRIPTKYEAPMPERATHWMYIIPPTAQEGE